MAQPLNRVKKASHTPNAEREANGYVSAAAPELLAAGKAALEIWEDLYSNMARAGEDDEEIAAFKALRAAIAKAEGKP